MKKVAALLALVLASAALVACGDDDGTTTTDTGGEATNGAATEGGGSAEFSSTIQIEADPEGGLAFTADSISAKAGDVTIDFKNPQPVGHDADVEDESGKVVGETDVITESSDTGTMKDLKPGKYVYFCSVPGHREGGMEGTLTVK